MKDSKITIGAVLDIKEAEKKLESLKKQIKQMTEMGPRGAVAGINKQFNLGGDSEREQRFEQFKHRTLKNNKEEMIKLAKEQGKVLDDDLKKHRELQNRIEAQQSLLEKGLTTQVKFEKRITELKKEQLELTNKITQTASVVSGANTGIDGLEGTAKKQLSLSDIGSRLAKGAAALIAATELAKRIIDFGPKQAGRRAGMAVATSSPMARAMNEEAASDIMYAPERAKALDRTMDFFAQKDATRQISSTLKVLAGTAATIVGVGTMLTGAVPLGAAIAAGGIATLSQEETFNKLTGRQTALLDMTGQEAIDAFKKYEMEEKTRDPVKYQQKEFFLKNRQALLSLQRSTGMNDEQLFGEGGYLTSGEFSTSEKMNMAQQMVGAGGSGSASFGKANETALRAQRSMGLTNAGQAMGRLTSYLSQNESDEAFVKILSKGVKIGLNESEYREEQKDFLMQVTSLSRNIVGGEALVSTALSSAIEGDISMRNLELAGDSFKQVMDELSDTEGPTAASRARLIDQDTAFKNIKGTDRLIMQNMRFEDINEQSGKLDYLYKKAGGEEGTGLSKAAFADRLRDKFNKAFTASIEDTDLGKRMRELEEKYQTQREDYTQDDEDEYSALRSLLDNRQKLAAEEKSKAKTALGVQGQISFQQQAVDKTRGIIDQDPTLAADKMSKVEADLQAKTLAGMNNTISEVSNNMERYRDLTAEHISIMQNLNDAIKEGPDALDKLFSLLRKKAGKPTSFGREASKATIQAKN
jgi:hypothetical protein